MLFTRTTLCGCLKSGKPEQTLCADIKWENKEYRVPASTEIDNCYRVMSNREYNLDNHLCKFNFLKKFNSETSLETRVLLREIREVMKYWNYSQ